MRHYDPLAPGYCDPSTFGFNGKLAVLNFGGGSPPPAPPNIQAPAQQDTSQTGNEAAQAAAKKNGLRKTLLQDMTAASNPGAQSTLGSSTLLGGGA